VNSSAVDSPVATPQSDRLLFGSFFGLFRKFLSASRKGLLGRACRRERRLRLCETVPLGERRLVALIQFDNQPLLVGVTPSSITLLSQPAPCAPAASPLSDFRDSLRASGEPQ
jgi:flagellar biogenesis protein FliO